MIELLSCFFPAYNEQTRRVAGGEVEVIPLETLRLGLRGDTLKEVLLGERQPATT